MPTPRPEQTIDTSRPHSARMYDHYLGGKDHFEVDRQAAEGVAQIFPSIFTCARELRSFMNRATRVLARDHGIRQWLDIGTGIPTEPNLHQIAQAIAPEARVVYADNDPLVLKYAERLMLTAPEGRTAYVHADIRTPEELLDSPELNDVLDLKQPVALSLNAIMHFVPDDQGAYDIVDRLMAALPSGSALSLAHATPEFEPEAWEQIVALYARGGTPGQVRTRVEGERFFKGLELIEPGITMVHRWRPDPETQARVAAESVTDGAVSAWGGVALKP
ncbi:SAM-dependent methyltransferase [Streptomyces sp. enrichment culture]|uniref:SAM-dependent methyltransferase n=1 Tax=Streptomyces sp. enrichment culture TaxID=1795815 RepID=UPI003F568072